MDNILLPLKPSVRYSILTDTSRFQLISYVEGDTVKIEGKDGLKCNGKHGIIRYRGPISLQNHNLESPRHNTTWAERLQNTIPSSISNERMFCGTWFGIEIIVRFIANNHFVKIRLY